MKTKIRKRHEIHQGSQARLIVRYLDEIILLKKVLGSYLNKKGNDMREEMIGIELYKKIDKHLKNNNVQRVHTKNKEQRTIFI